MTQAAAGRRSATAPPRRTATTARVSVWPVVSRFSNSIVGMEGEADAEARRCSSESEVPPHLLAVILTARWLRY